MLLQPRAPFFVLLQRAAVADNDEPAPGPRKQNAHAPWITYKTSGARNVAPDSRKDDEVAFATLECVYGAHARIWFLVGDVQATQQDLPRTTLPPTPLLDSCISMQDLRQVVPLGNVWGEDLDVSGLHARVCKAAPHTDDHRSLHAISQRTVAMDVDNFLAPEPVDKARRVDETDWMRSRDQTNTITHCTRQWEIQRQRFPRCNARGVNQGALVEPFRRVPAYARIHSVLLDESHRLQAVSPLQLLVRALALESVRLGGLCELDETEA
mmetsp:Transcript_81134/g.225772  ORF Transcript_81134/g.225772 Transcript_81134/m.225772 type:complete len:268 (-) Transcript_81134:1623-2426(-)